MKLLVLLLNPGIIGLVAVFLTVVWMLRDERDKTRPILVIAIVINLIYGWLLSVVLGGADSLLPWKYDYYLLHIDQSLGLSGSWVALHFQNAWRIPLILVYQLMLPMMILWYLRSRKWSTHCSLVLAYVAEMLAGPIMYAIVPACGPFYAFGATWLHHPFPPPHLIRFSGMPNAFPSLHIATALVFVLLARGRLWRAISVAFLAGTALATLAMGEHYVIDLIPGLAFGCFLAASVGYRRWLSASFHLGLVLLWSVVVRFQSTLLIAHPSLVRLLAAVTLGSRHTSDLETNGVRGRKMSADRKRQVSARGFGPVTWKLPRAQSPCWLRGQPQRVNNELMKISAPAADERSGVSIS